MLSILIYVIVFSIIAVLTYFYYREREKPLRDQLETGSVLGVLFIVGLLTAINIYQYKPPLQKPRKILGNSSNMVERILIDKYPDERVQLTIVSEAADSTYTVVVTKDDVKKLMMALKE